MRLAIIGHGYVGLVTAAVFADLGNTVMCVGRDLKKIRDLNKGIPTFFEPGLEEVVKRNIKAKRLSFTLSYKEAITGADIIFIGVGTPSLVNGEADLSQVFTAVKSIAENLNGYTVIACKSTVPVGTNYKIKELVNKVNKQAQFDIASCPEFLREGSALSDSLNPDRIVIGTESEKAKNILLELHKPIQGKRILTNILTAELIKYTSNSLLAVKISFANAIALLSEKMGADVEKVLDGVGSDNRLGRSFLYPGIGFGGSCLPKDVKALIAQAHAFGYDFKLLKDVREINKQAAEAFISKVLKKFPKPDGVILCVLGLAFKANTDDMRDAPSLTIINSLKKKGFTIHAYDPQAISNAKKLTSNIQFFENAYNACKNASALLVLTEWNEFKQLNFVKLKELMKENILFDGRNMYDPDRIESLGFTYVGVGRS